MSVPVWVWFNSVMFAAGGVYLWWRLVAQTTAPASTTRRIGTVIFALIAVAAPIALLSQFLMPMGFQRVVGWPAWISYAFVIFTGCTALLVEPFRIVAWWRRRRRDQAAAALIGARVQAGGGAGPDVGPDAGSPSDAGDVVDGRAVSRRVAVRRILAGGILAVGATLTGVALAGALGQPRVRQQNIAIRSLPAAAAGTRIALISDLHVGALTSLRRLPADRRPGQCPEPRHHMSGR